MGHCIVHACICFWCLCFIILATDLGMTEVCPFWFKSIEYVVCMSLALISCPCCIALCMDELHCVKNLMVALHFVPLFWCYGHWFGHGWGLSILVKVHWACWFSCCSHCACLCYIALSMSYCSLHWVCHLTLHCVCYVVIRIVYAKLLLCIENACP